MSSNGSCQDPHCVQEKNSRTHSNSFVDSEGHRERKRSLLSSICVSVGDFTFCKTRRKNSFKVSTSSQGPDCGESRRPSSDIVCTSVHRTFDQTAPGFKSESLDCIFDDQRRMQHNQQISAMEVEPPNDHTRNSSGINSEEGQSSAVSSSNEKFNEYTFNRDLWKVKKRYTNLETLSAGSFGTVCSATDSETGVKVAIKRMNQPYKTNFHAKRALRELKLLKFCDHDNLLSVLDAFTTATAPHLMIDLYLVTPLMETDLASVIRHFALSEQQRMTEDHINFFMYQILRGLKYLHFINIVHRDLKPSNIAVNADCSLKIIDYGLCRGVSSEMTGYVQTRWYRAPEVMMDWSHYDYSVDLWSVGCILGEMLLGKPVFPGRDHVDLLQSHVFVCGTPDDETLSGYESAQAASFIRDRLGNQPRQDFETYFRSTRSCDLLDRLLQMDPRRRLSAEQALEHPYFAQLGNPTDEVISSEYFDCTFENKTSTQDLKEAIFSELLSFDTHQSQRQTTPNSK